MRKVAVNIYVRPRTAPKPRRQQIPPSDLKKAVKLLKPKDGAQCAADVRKAMAAVDDPFEQDASRLLGSFSAKTELKKVVVAIKKLKSSIRKLPEPFRSEFDTVGFLRPDDDIVGDAGELKITVYDLDDLIADAEKMLEFPSAPRHRPSHRQSAAVREAAALLRKYGHEPTATAGGKWDRLAVLLLSGEPRVKSLKPHLLKHKQLGSKPNSK